MMKVIPSILRKRLIMEILSSLKRYYRKCHYGHSRDEYFWNSNERVDMYSAIHSYDPFPFVSVYHCCSNVTIPLHYTLHFYIHFALIFESIRIAAIPRVHHVNFEDIGWFKRIKLMEDWRWKWFKETESSLARESVHMNSCQDSLLLVLFESRKFRESILLYFASREYLQKEQFIKDWRWKERLKRLNRLWQGSQFTWILVKTNFSCYCSNRVNSASRLYYTFHQENIFGRRNLWKTEGGRMIQRGSSLARESVPFIIWRLASHGDCSNRVISASPFFYILQQENIFGRKNSWKTEGGRMIQRGSSLPRESVPSIILSR